MLNQPTNNVQLTKYMPTFKYRMTYISAKDQPIFLLKGCYREICKRQFIQDIVLTQLKRTLKCISSNNNL